MDKAQETLRNSKTQTPGTESASKEKRAQDDQLDLGKRDANKAPSVGNQPKGHI